MSNQETTSVAALRPSQPSAEREEPRVGETWHSDTYEKNWGPLLVLRRYDNGDFQCRGSGGLYAGCSGSFCPEDLTRRLSAPSADKWEPKPGDHVSAVAWCNGEDKRFEGVYIGPYLEDGREPNQWRDHHRVANGPDSPVCPRSSLRLIRPATPSPKAGEVTLATPPRHGKSEFQRKLLEKVSGSVLVSKAEPSLYPTVQGPKPDPYAAHRRDLALRSVEHYSGPESMLDKRIASAKAQHLADLDRGKAERLRNTRHWPEAWSTAGDES